MRQSRKHEWAWGDVGKRTVCGLMGGLYDSTLADFTVHDLGDIEAAERCRNCERMRSAIGTSIRSTEATP